MSETNRIIIESILPSGRGIRIEKIRTKQYREAAKRAMGKLAGENVSAEIYSMAMALELLLTSLRATTAEPVKLIFAKHPETGEETNEVDLDATLEAVPAAAWRSHSYIDLIKAEEHGGLDSVLPDPIEYDDALMFAQRNIVTAGPLGRTISRKVRVIGE